MMKEKFDITFCNLLKQIVSKSQKQALKTTKTHILKLSYLVELEYFRQTKTRLTSVEWVYFKYGPYLFDYDSYIDGKCISVVKPNDDFSLLNYNTNYDIPELDRTAERLIDRVIKRFGDMPLTKLLDYIYYDTEPMMNVESRNEVLDFDTVLPLDPLHDDLKLSKKELSDLLYRVKKELNNATSI